MNTQDSCRDLTQNKYYQRRLNTFEEWPKQMIPDKYSLAKSGFVYAVQGDKVRCYQCGVGINRWERTDNAWTEHKKWSPNCEYLKIVGCYDGIDEPDKRNEGFGGFGQPKPSAGTFGLPKPKTPVRMDTSTAPSTFTFGRRTDSHLF